ncbi:MAG: hypothetical protein GYB25_13930 [Rhodobacteraceae bacterium]|nr:hypothetical protein [Paracoccaceae bacterium]
MTNDSDAAHEPHKPFLYTEELGLSLMLNQRSGKKLGMDKDMWADLLSSIEAGKHPAQGCKDD